MQVGPPDKPVVKTTLRELPVVADHLAIKLFVEAGACAGHVVVGANADPKKLEALVGLRGVTEDAVLARLANGGAEGGDRSELIGVFETNRQGLAAPHRQTGNGAVVSVF